MKASVLFLLLFSVALCTQAQTNTLKIEPLEPDVYGSSCGLVGSNPALRDRLETYLSAEDVEAIDAWLFSDNATKQVYAVEALFRLEESGLEFTTLHTERIAEVKRSKEMVATCTGCLMGEMMVSEILASYRLH